MKQRDHTRAHGDARRLTEIAHRRVLFDGDVPLGAERFDVGQHHGVGVAGEKHLAHPALAQRPTGLLDADDFMAQSNFGQHGAASSRHDKFRGAYPRKVEL